MELVLADYYIAIAGDIIFPNLAPVESIFITKYLQSS